VAHLIQNGQEATTADGNVEIRVYREQDTVIIEIKDDGCGMSEKFIQERLFRPFDTTKGNAGMGIGVYESREFVWSQGGDMEVDSCEGGGTTFRIRLSLSRVQSAGCDSKKVSNVVN
jgi:signal transduction histidine kinase